MAQNLKLPLCPKCGDTRFVEDKVDWSLCIPQKPEYGCTVCKIRWSERRIIDENDNIVYSEINRGLETLRSHTVEPG